MEHLGRFVAAEPQLLLLPSQSWSMKNPNQGGFEKKSESLHQSLLKDKVRISTLKRKKPKKNYFFFLLQVAFESQQMGPMNSIHVSIRRGKGQIHPLIDENQTRQRSPSLSHKNESEEKRSEPNKIQKSLLFRLNH